MKILLYDLFIGWWLDLPPTMVEQRRAAWKQQKEEKAA